MVDLSQLYSNPFLQIRSFKQRIDPQISAHSSEPLTSENKLEAIEKHITKTPKCLWRDRSMSHTTKAKSIV